MNILVQIRDMNGSSISSFVDGAFAVQDIRVVGDASSSGIGWFMHVEGGVFVAAQQAWNLKTMTKIIFNVLTVCLRRTMYKF